MSRKRNTGRSGKKAKGYGSVAGSKGGGMRKHGKGGKTTVNRVQRILACKERNHDEAERKKRKRRRVTCAAESVAQLMKERR